MRKSDSSKHNKCIASIKRSTIKPYDFKWTNFYESKEEFENKYSGLIHEFEPDELPICSTVIDLNNWSILTTRRIITKYDSKLSQGYIDEKAIDKLYGEFKDNKNKDWTLGVVGLEEGKDFEYFIETGKASMIIIHGVRTLIRLNRT